MYGPVEVCGYGQKNPNGLPSDHGCESVEAVDTMCLLEAPSNQPGFVSWRSAVVGRLDFKDPLAGNGSFVRR